MIIVTGGEGFIGKNLIEVINDRIDETVVSLDTKSRSLIDILEFIREYKLFISGIFHMGAISDTTETNTNKLYRYNYDFSIELWKLCAEYNIPLIYASSAATYGNDTNFNDNTIENLKPLNSYGYSKQRFDEYVMDNCVNNELQPPNWYGLKFFNVYGQNEEHKGNMASVMYHFREQALNTGKIKLFRSYNDKYGDGEQLRDFIYVNDIVNVCLELYLNKPTSGIYNVGTGKPTTYNDVARAVFKTLGIVENIEYIEMPMSLREQYQYYTCANIDKLKSIGVDTNFVDVDYGVKLYYEYIKNS